jgi:hypothetical protein
LQPRNLLPSRRKLLILATAIGIFFPLTIAIGVAVFLSPLLTSYLESDAFRVAMEKETAKGLHFPQASYAPIRRIGALTAQSDNFKADHGQKAMKALDAHGITAKFDPWGVFLRQWRFTDVRVQSGDSRFKSTKRILKQCLASRGSQFFCRTEFTWRRSNRNRPTLPGVFAMSGQDFSEPNCSSRRTAGISSTSRQVAD